MSVGLLGGACEYLLCTRRKRASLHRDGSNVDVNYSMIPESTSHTDLDEVSLAGEKAGYEQRSMSHEELGRYSWQTTSRAVPDIYVEGNSMAVPPPQIPPKALTRLEPKVHETKRRDSDPSTHGVRDPSKRANKFWAPDVVSPPALSEPQFLVHDEQDDREYQEELRSHPGTLVGRYEPTLLPSTASSGGMPESSREGYMPLQERSLLSASRVSSDDVYGEVGRHEESYRAAHDDFDEGRTPVHVEFEPWLPTVDTTDDDQPLQEITLVDHGAEEKTTGTPTTEKMWRTHPTQFL